MEKEKKLPGNIRVVFHPSSRALKMMVIVLIVFSMIALTALSWVKLSIQNRTEELRSEAAALEEENADLEKKIEDPTALESIRELARELFGLVDPDTIIIDTD